MCSSDLSHIPLVQYFRYAKTEIWQREREHEKASVARERFEFRNLRIERDKQEREAMLAQKRAQLAAQKSDAAAGSDTAPDDKQRAIAEAMARAKARKEALQLEKPSPKSADAGEGGE